MAASVIPKLTLVPDDDEIPLDLTQAFVKGLEWLMLAQAQECSWQAAKIGNAGIQGSCPPTQILRQLDHYKNGIIARVAAKVFIYEHLLQLNIDIHDVSQAAAFYQLASSTIRDAYPSVKHMLPSVRPSNLDDDLVQCPPGLVASYRSKGAPL